MKKKDQHNLTEIGKSMKMNEKCHFSVRVSRAVLTQATWVQSEGKKCP